MLELHVLLTRWHLAAELKFINSRIVSVERAVMPTQLARILSKLMFFHFVVVVVVNYSHRRRQGIAIHAVSVIDESETKNVVNHEHSTGGAHLRVRVAGK